MKIKCLNGYFMFYESFPGEISRFNSMYGYSVVPKDDYYTFEALVDAPEFSLVASPYLDLVGVESFEGKPWEVFEANGFVFDFDSNELVLKETVTTILDLKEAGNYFISDGLILPGSLKRLSVDRAISYTAYLDWGVQNFKYTEVVYG